MESAVNSVDVAALKELERRNRDLGASDYLDQVRRERGSFRLRAEAAGIVAALAPRGDEIVLDAGAGVGRLALEMAPRVARLTCVDLSQKALDELARNASRRGLRNVATQQADLCALPASLGTFDAAYSVEVVQHIPSAAERLAALRQIYERLTRGGRCLVSVCAWNARSGQPQQETFWGEGERRLYVYAFTPADLADLMRAAGFRNVAVRALGLLPGRLTRFLPPALAPVERALSAIPALTPHGRYVMAVGYR
jgi:SAM-dependent methyltransferase